ncbi:MAG: atpF [Parcubacteria group bacterium]|nr:atpF [Parcubacteria group bacterium]
MGSLLDAFGIQPQLLLAQAINFAVLFGALSYLLYKPVLKTLEERRVVVAKGVEDARAAEEALATADEKASTVVHSAETEAEGIVGRARAEAGVEKAKLVKDAEARAAAIAADAEARAKETAAKTLRESEKEIARLAVLAAEKAMRTA